MSQLEAILTSPPDRESVVFEIWCGDQQVAEISKEPTRSYEIELYAAPGGVPWQLDLNEFKSMLDNAINELARNP